MTGRVLALAPPPGPDEEVIACLEDALEKARKGEIVCIAYAAAHRDGAITTAMTVPWQHTFTMFGAIERLKLRFYAVHVEE